MNSKVSILIPLYNSEAYIAETISSALAQKWTDKEIIIVDDGSTDKSYEIAKSFESSTVKVYRNPGKGACSARNYAYEKSCGDYIQYLDADDLLSPDKIEKQMHRLLQNSDLQIANCRWGRFSESIESVVWEMQSIDKDYEKPIDWLCDSWLLGGMAQTSVWLTPRKLIEMAGGWNESLTINQDGEFFCRVLLRATSICFCDVNGVYYRSGLQSSISQNSKNSVIKARSLLDSYNSYYRYAIHIDNSERVRKALATNYLNYIYQFYHEHNEIAREAEDKFYSLGFKKMWPVGGRKFKLLVSIFGFKVAMQLRHIL